MPWNIRIVDITGVILNPIKLTRYTLIEVKATSKMYSPMFTS